MVGPDGLEQRTADLEEFFHDELDHCDIAEQLGDEARDDSEQWMFHRGVDEMNWPTPINVMPRSTEALEAQARAILKRMAERS